MFSQPVDGPGKLRKQVRFCVGQREQASRNGSGRLSEPLRCCSCRGPRTARCRAQGRRGRGERRVGDGGGGEPCPVRKGHRYSDGLARGGGEPDKFLWPGTRGEGPPTPGSPRSSAPYPRQHSSPSHVATTPSRCYPHST